MNTPNIATHVPVIEEIPREEEEHVADRPDAPTPSLWQRAVKVSHKVTKRVAVVHKIDWYTNQFRAYFPDEQRFSTRTEWESCANWDVEVTFSAAELERQAAATKLADEIAKLTGRDLALASVLCDDPDPKKALGKLEMMISAGLILGNAEALAAAAAEVRIPEEPKTTRPSVRKGKPEPEPKPEG